MKTVLKVQCPACGYKWRMPGDEPFPNFCPANGCQLSVPDPKFVPSKVTIRSVQGVAENWTYRKLEADSEARAEKAEPMIEQQLVDAGISRENAQRAAASQARDLLITNMRDNIRDGEPAAMPVSNTVTGVQDAMAAAGMWQGNWQGGMGVASAGPAPFNESGAKGLYAIQSSRGGTTPAAPASVSGMKAGFGRAG